MKRKMKLFAKLKKAWNKCLAKSNNNQILCKIKIKVKKAKYWKNHHKKFWKENLMRWNAMKEFKLAMAKFMNAKNLVEKLDYKNSEFYKNELNKKLERQKPEEMEEAVKQDIISLKSKVKEANKIESLAEEVQIYESQKSSWENSNAGKCLKFRTKSFLMNLGSIWGKNIAQDVQDEFKKDVVITCEKVPKYLPFANGGCLDALSINYAKLILDFKNFLNNKSEDNVKIMMKGLLQAQQIMKNDCIKPLIEADFSKCREYIEQKLNLSALKDEIESENALELSVKIATQWNRYGNILKSLSDETFWLNAPEQCGIGEEAYQ